MQAQKLSTDTNHVLVFIYSKAAADKLGRIALARIFLDDGSFISMIYQNLEDKGLHWRPPYMQLTQNGHTENFPTLGGPLLDAVEKICKKAQNRLHAKYPDGAPFGTTFKVTREGVEIVPNPDSGPLGA